ncbi:SDR family NAD(P)-dependent oxidoreductase [Kineobactrum salinum]|uniref:Glucose 1-dehydrogenase n=1 Tax=Kineobactrum salinum TaxID=2708301 RepID=A0A6C0U635_9GAMM|nr:glucose 1-dehydrogenase [Kineobactrum salinum]QIB66819.1 glucose 1-dehydrogenase [Kineobactrum salinum]
MEFSGKTAFITGASRGIGQATAVAFAQAGARIMAVDLDKESLCETVKLIHEIGGQVESYAADVTDVVAVSMAVNATVEHFGSLDCAVNNAGLYPQQIMVDEIEEELARKTMEVNYWGAFNGMREEIRVMKSQNTGGTIVNISSGAGLFAFPLSSAYCASKHAVIGLTKSAGIDYAAQGIRINAVCPGAIETRMVDSLLATNEARTALTAGHPIGRLGHPKDIADAVLWLSSTRAEFVIGIALPVDGGYTAL